MKVFGVFLLQEMRRCLQPPVTCGQLSIHNEEMWRNLEGFLKCNNIPNVYAGDIRST